MSQPKTTTTFDEEYQGTDRPQASAEASIPVATFESAYAGTPPWDIPGAQPAFVGLAWKGEIAGRVLDVGCGTGENALLLASRSLDVVGIDASATAIAKAQAKAAERGLHSQFLVGDALDLADVVDGHFDTVTDCGVLHIFSDEDRRRFVDSIAAVLRPGGRYIVLCFSEHASIPGPRRLTQDDLRRAFGAGWRIVSIDASHVDINVNEGGSWRPERAAAWLACIERTADAHV